MKFVTFIEQNQEKLGFLIGAPGSEKVVDAAAALKSSGTDPGALDILKLLREQSKWMPALQKLATNPASIPTAAQLPLNNTCITAPVPHPTSMRDGYAFRQHVETARRNRGLPMIPEFDQFPIFYYTNHLQVTGPGDLEVMPLAMDKLDFELEVAIVIGKEGRNIKASQADEYIFGYMIMNDWSARTLQMEEMKLNLGPAKGKDFATTLGPVLVTRDELAKFAIPSPNGERHDLRMKAFVNGKQVSDGNVKDMSWTFGQIIERASYGVTLRPGEVIGSGTVGTGCFLELNGSKITDNQWLKAGDEVVLEVDQLGRLVNRIKAAHA